MIFNPAATKFFSRLDGSTSNDFYLNFYDTEKFYVHKNQKH